MKAAALLLALVFVASGEPREVAQREREREIDWSALLSQLAYTAAPNVAAEAGRKQLIISFAARAAALGERKGNEKKRRQGS